MIIIEQSSRGSVDSRENSSGFSPHESNQEYDTVLSDEARRVLEIFFFVAIIGPVSVLGSAANIVNIVIFYKQGFSDTVSISLCDLAVSDLCSLLPLVWISVCFNPLFQSWDLAFDPLQIQYITAGWPHGCFVSITNWITAFITFERCVCVALPMKVKDIIAHKGTFILIVVIFLTMFASISPVFCCISIAPRFNAQLNRTQYELAYSTNAEQFENISSAINIVTQFSCLIIVIVSTAVLIYNLRSNSQWRHKVLPSSQSSNSDSVSTPDKRVIKIVTSISCIFIVCYFPSAVNIVVQVLLSQHYSILGKYRNCFKTSWAILNTIESVNSSVNIFVYYNMSSKFRVCLIKLFNIGQNRADI